jgi:hypothetical protein
MQSVLSKALLGLAAAILAVSMPSTLAQSKAPGMGTWKLNLEKSKHSPGPAPKSLTVKIEPSGKGIKVMSEAMLPDGRTAATEFTANYDGKDYPMKGSPFVDTVALTRVDALTNTRVDKKGGKVVATHRRAIAKDDKTWSVEIKGTNAKGEPFHNVLFFERM